MALLDAIDDRLAEERDTEWVVAGSTTGKAHPQAARTTVKEGR